MAALTALDLVIFFGSLVAVMAVGLWAGRKEETSEDYFLAGKTTRWWGVAGSIFGSNVSAGHLIGMMGVGFTVGFAQSHFELGAIAALLLLAYGFLPVYRRLNVYTLSEYLEKRYDDRARVLYALAMIFLMVVIQMVPGFYIGSRSLNVLMLENTTDLKIDQTYYVIGILMMAVVTGAYTIFGGLKAVIITDVIQSVLMLVAGLTVAYLTFRLDAVGGWSGMRELDVAAEAAGEAGKMHLYLDSNHPELPWTGVLTGLFMLHFFYWSTNQFIVQRTLAAQSDREARLGIITAGFFKLLIPFFSIGTGIAAYYYYNRPGSTPPPQDAVFVALLRDVVRPVGYGVVGLVAAGLVGAILSSIDSMMNSASTIITFDIYKRYINPEASEAKLIWVGRVWIAILVVAAALLTILTMDPNSEDNFFMQIKNHEAALLPALLVPFAVGMFWKRATATGAVAAMIVGWILSYALPPLYESLAASNAGLAATFGEKLNFLHNALLASVGSVLVHVIVSLLTQKDDEKAQYTWTDLGGHDPADLKRLAAAVCTALGGYVLLGLLQYNAVIPAALNAWIAAIFTLTLFTRPALRSARARVESGTCSTVQRALLGEDRLWAGLLAACSIYMMFYYA